MCLLTCSVLYCVKHAVSHLIMMFNRLLYLLMALSDTMEAAEGNVPFKGID